MNKMVETRGEVTFFKSKNLGYLKSETGMKLPITQSVGKPAYIHYLGTDCRVSTIN